MKRLRDTSIIHQQQITEHDIFAPEEENLISNVILCDDDSTKLLQHKLTSELIKELAEIQEDYVLCVLCGEMFCDTEDGNITCSATMCSTSPQDQHKCGATVCASCWNVHIEKSLVSRCPKCHTITSVDELDIPHMIRGIHILINKRMKRFARNNHIVVELIDIARAWDEANDCPNADCFNYSYYKDITEKALKDEESGEIDRYGPPIRPTELILFKYEMTSEIRNALELYWQLLELWMLHPGHNNVRLAPSGTGLGFDDLGFPVRPSGYPMRFPEEMNDPQCALQK